MNELYIAIALICINPNYPGDVQKHQGECIAKILECYRNEGISNSFIVQEQRMAKCLRKL